MANIPELPMEAPTQPSFPQVNLSLLPQGLSITVQLGPTTAFVQLIEAAAMDQVAKQWRESRKNAMDIIRAVQSSKVG